MPYQTPLASQYTMIKRLQTAITGKAHTAAYKFRAPSVYGGYSAGLSIGRLPPNAVKSNKFPPEYIMTLERALDDIITGKITTTAVNKLYTHLSDTTKSVYQDILQKLNGPQTFQMSPKRYLILPDYGNTDNVVITPPSLNSGVIHVYIVYPGSSITISNQPADIIISFDGTRYTHTCGGVTYDLRDNDFIVPGLRFNKGSVVLGADSTPFPFPPGVEMEPNAVVWFRGVYFDWINEYVAKDPSTNWSVDGELPNGYSLDPQSGRITGTIATDFLLNDLLERYEFDIVASSNPNDIDVPKYRTAIKIIPDLRLNEISTPKTISVDGYSNSLGNTIITIPLNKDVSFSVFEIDPDYPGTSMITRVDLHDGTGPTSGSSSDKPFQWAILPKLPSGLNIDSATGVISGKITENTNLDYRIAVRDPEYPWDKSMRVKYFTLRSEIKDIPVIDSTPIIAYVNEPLIINLNRLIDMTNVRYPYMFSTTTTLPSTIRLTTEGVLQFNNPTTEAVYELQIKVEDGLNGLMKLTVPIVVSVQIRRFLVLRPRDSIRQWGSASFSSDGTKLVVYNTNGQIHTSTDSGVTWIPRESDRNWQSVASSADGTKLVALANQDKIYTSTDSGVTWIPREDNRFWSSVASSEDGTKLVACVFGLYIYTSTDSGVTWTPRDNYRLWNSVASSADGTKLVACAYNGQIYTSTDSGLTWTARDSNRQWKSVASSADGTKLVACAYNGQIYTSTDSGVTWVPRYSNRIWECVASSADGTKLVACVYNGQIYTSADSGITWIPREDNRNWSGIALSNDGRKIIGSVNGGQIYIGQLFDSELDALVYEINQNIDDINKLLDQGVSRSLITQGAATRASDFILSGGYASSTEFYIILSGGTP